MEVQTSKVLAVINAKGYAPNNWRALVEYENARGGVGVYQSATGDDWTDRERAFALESIWIFLVVDGRVAWYESRSVKLSKMALEDVEAIAKFADATQIFQHPKLIEFLAQFR